MVAWTGIVAVEVMRNGWILSGCMLKAEAADLVTDWVQGMRERS